MFENELKKEIIKAKNKESFFVTHLKASDSKTKLIVQIVGGYDLSRMHAVRVHDIATLFTDILKSSQDPEFKAAALNKLSEHRDILHSLSQSQLCD